MNFVDSLHFPCNRENFCQKYRKLLISCPSRPVSQTPCNYFVSGFCRFGGELQRRCREVSNRGEKHQKAPAATLIPEFSPSPSDSLRPGEADERVLVPEPLREADGPAHQEDAGQDSQLSGEGQRVVRRTFGEGKRKTFSFINFLGEAAVG